MNINLLLTLLLITICSITQAQVILPSAIEREKATSVSVTDLKRCGHDFVFEYLKSHFPDHYDKIKLEKSYKTSPTSTSAASGIVYTVPVVIHVVHNGDAIGSNENITAAQASSQIDVLNEDFRRLNADASLTPPAFASVAADVEIEFCLAQRTPSGAATTGIERYNGGNDSWNMEDIENILKPATTWDASKYINIWTVNFSSDVTITSYAYLPGAPADVDGIVVGYEHFGSAGTVVAPYNKGRTATHEMGHYFNLKHVWGDEPDCVSDDGISDTPLQKGHNYGCPTFPLTTGSGASCSSADGSMFMNFMDYSDDGCRNLFTLDQKAVMLVALLGPRAGLLTSDGCVPTTAVPIAEFSSSSTSICAGGNVTFNNLSSYASSYSWTFTGGTPSTSTEINPSISYNTPGTYDVTLIASNAFGTDVQTYSGLITVTTCSIAPCVTLSNVNSSEVYYFITSAGYIAGHNSYQDMAKADFFNYSGAPTTVNSLRIKFAKAYSSSSTGYVRFTIWDDDGIAGVPGTILGYQNVLINAIADSVDASTYYYTQVFSTPIPINGPFYAGVQLFYPSTVGSDTICMLSTTDATSSSLPNGVTAWQQTSGGDWGNYAVAYDGLLDVAHYIFPKIGSLPESSFSIAPSTACVGETISLSNTSSNATTYSWSMPGAIPTSSTLTNPNIVYSTSGTKTITLSANNACGNDSYSSTILINAPPAITVSASSLSVCAGTASVLSASGAGVGGTYTWIAPGFSSSSSSITVYPSITTTYTVTGTNSLGCSNTNAITIIATSTPVLTITSTSTSICAGTSVSMTVSGAVGGVYTWSAGLGTGTTKTVTPTATTTYTVVWTDGICSASATITINVSSEITVLVNASESIICEGNNTTLTASGGIGGSYTWSPGGATGSSITVSPTSTTVYTVLWSGVDCSGSGSSTINVIYPPTLAVTSTSGIICIGSSTTLTASGASGGSYVWSSPDGSTSPGANITVSPSVSSTYTLNWTNEICNANTSYTVSIVPTPPLYITPSAPNICIGESVTLTASGPTDGTYTWSTGFVGNSINVSPSSSSTYFVDWENSYCSNSASVSVNVSSSPAINVSSSNDFACLGDTITLTAEGPIAGIYTWNPGSYTGASISVNPTSTTTYTIDWVGSTCYSSAIYTQNIWPLPATPTISLSGTDLISSASSGNQWYINGVAISGANNALLTPTENGAYYVSVTDANGCESLSAVYTVSWLTIDENQLGVNLYPNPISETIWINTPNTIDIDIIDIHGRIVCITSCKGNCMINTADWAAGVYIIRCSNNRQETFISKIIKK